MTDCYVFSGKNSANPAAYHVHCICCVPDHVLQLLRTCSGILQMLRTCSCTQHLLHTWLCMQLFPYGSTGLNSCIHSQVCSKCCVHEHVRTNRLFRWLEKKKSRSAQLPFSRLRGAARGRNFCHPSLSPVSERAEVVHSLTSYFPASGIAYYMPPFIRRSP